MPGKKEITPRVICRAVHLIEIGQITGSIEDVVHRWLGAGSAEIMEALKNATTQGLVGCMEESGRWIVTDAGRKLLREWLAVITKSSFGAEASVARELQNRGYTPWYPLAERTMVRRGKVVTLTSALFANYVFVQRDPLMRLGPVRSCPGVVRIECNASGVPLWFRDSQFDGVRKLIEESGGVYRFNQQPDRREWKHCDRVRINGGPMEGWTGVVYGPHLVGPDDHVRLSIDTDHGSVRVSVPDVLLDREEPKPLRSAVAIENPENRSRKKRPKRALQGAS